MSSQSEKGSTLDSNGKHKLKKEWSIRSFWTGTGSSAASPNHYVGFKLDSVRNMIMGWLVKVTLKMCNTFYITVTRTVSNLELE